MIVVIALCGVGGFWFLAQRGTEPAPSARVVDQRGKPVGAAAAAAPVAITFVAIGAVFSSNTISMVAVCESLGATWASGPILGVGSIASMVGALVYGARVWRSPLWARYTVGLVAMAGASALFLVANSFGVLVVVSFASGVAISPTFINGNDMISRLVPAGTLTEGLTWIGTALGVGGAAGSTVAGAMIDAHGARAGYWVLGAAAGAIAVLTLATAPIVRARSRAAAGEQAIGGVG
jgi:MFS family permease